MCLGLFPTRPAQSIQQHVIGQDSFPLLKGEARNCLSCSVGQKFDSCREECFHKARITSNDHVARVLSFLHCTERAEGTPWATHQREIFFFGHVESIGGSKGHRDNKEKGSTNVRGREGNHVAMIPSTHTHDIPIEGGGQRGRRQSQEHTWMVHSSNKSASRAGSSFVQAQ